MHYLSASSIFLLLLTSIAVAQVPKVYVIDMWLEGIFLEAGKPLSGNFTAWNAESYMVRDITYRILLTDLDKVIVDVMYANVSFDLRPGEGKSFDFSYVPPRLPAGEYYLYLQLTLKKGLWLPWKEVKVKLRESREKYVYCNDSFILKGGEKHFPLEGVPFLPGEVPVAVLNAYNPKAEELVVRICTTVYRREENLEVVHESCEKDPLTLRPGSNLLSLKLPPMEKPESYLAKISFVDKSGVISAGETRFRYVIVGPDAEILTMRFEERGLSFGETFELEVEVVGPADGSDLGEGLLVVELVDPRGSCGKAEAKVRLWDKREVVKLSPIAERDCKPSAIQAKIVHKNQALDAYSYQFPTPLPKPEEKAPGLMPAIIALIVVGIIVGLALVKIK